MQNLSIGKMRGLYQCATNAHVFSILALDHRNNLKKALNPDNPENVTDDQLVSFKKQVTAALAGAASAVLLDPQFGAAQCMGSGALPGKTGAIVALEATGYEGHPNARKSRVLSGWSVKKIRRMGASAVKLLVYYHPDSPLAVEIENLVGKVALDCQASDLPLFLEPLSYSLEPGKKKLPPGERLRVVIETARRLTPLGVDVLKAEFPVDIAAEPDETRWATACEELTSASVTPWVLLSASVDFEVYLRQVEVACQKGASGVAVGRAVWKEAAGLSREDRQEFLSLVARERMRRVTDLCQTTARPFLDYFQSDTIRPDWYADYQEE